MQRIRLTKEELKKQTANILKQLRLGKSISTSLNISLQLDKLKAAKANLIFSEVAKQKMEALTDGCSYEIAWHATAIRGEKYNDFLVEDVFVFPQEVSSATVRTDDKAYPTWLYSLPEDVLNNLKMHGHSHVNMAVSPSGTDTTYQGDILKNLEDFYIFLIMNKRKEIWVRILDVTNNILYDTADITTNLYTNNHVAWAEDQIKEHVSISKPKYTSYYARQGRTNLADYYANYDYRNYT